LRVLENKAAALKWQWYPELVEANCTQERAAVVWLGMIDCAVCRTAPFEVRSSKL
jgi:Ni,Fe-hydrogenase I small subunit